MVDKILPNSKVEIILELENDDNIIYRNVSTNSTPVAAGDARRDIVTKMVLWVPKMFFNQLGEELYLSKYMKKHEWTYLRERIEGFASQQRQGIFKISPLINRP